MGQIKMQNTIFILLITISCTYALKSHNLAESAITHDHGHGHGHAHHGSHTDCSKDGHHPHYYTVPQLMNMDSDKRFKNTIQKFMDYFHAACDSYQVWYTQNRISEMMMFSPAETDAFFKRFVKVGFNPHMVDPRIAGSLQAIGKNAQKKITENDNCTEDAKAPKWASLRSILKRLSDKKLKKVVENSIKYYSHTCNATQIWAINKRVSEALKLSNGQRKTLLRRLQKNGLADNEEIKRIIELFNQIAKITNAPVVHH